MSIITIDNIKKIKRHRYFRVESISEGDREYNKKWNNESYKNLLRLMVVSMQNNCTETLILMRNEDFKFEITTDHSFTNVDFSYNMKRILILDNSYTYTAFHNHPNDSVFSVKDLITFLTTEKLDAMFVCTNSCKYIGLVLKGDRHKHILSMVSKILSYAQKLSLIRSIAPADKLLDVLHKIDILTLYYSNY